MEFRNCVGTTAVCDAPHMAYISFNKRNFMVPWYSVKGRGVPDKSDHPFTGVI
jgi:hypothetical protein